MMVHSLPILLMEIGFMAMLLVVALAVLRMRSLFAIVMLQGVYSLLCAAWFVSLDAVDVAFTEAAVGAGVSTVLMLGAMLLTDRDANPLPTKRRLGPLFVVIIMGIAMFYALGDMPAFGDAHSAVNTGVGAQYVQSTREEMFLPNVVTAVLASYRGYDTFGETVVIFMAGLGVVLLLGLNGNAGKWRAKPNGQSVAAPSQPPVKMAAAAKPVKTAAAKRKPVRRKSAKPKAGGTS